MLNVAYFSNIETLCCWLRPEVEKFAECGKLNNMQSSHNEVLFPCLERNLMRECFLEKCLHYFMTQVQLKVKRAGINPPGLNFLI